MPDLTERLPDGAKVLKDGEAICILRGWIGHDLDREALWEKTVLGMENATDKWSKHCFTMEGRKLVMSFIILSKAQYMLMTNNPPAPIIDWICELVQKTTWHGKAKSIIKLDNLYHQLPLAFGNCGMHKVEG